ncbi:hypothetical protein ABZ890_12020 [Streptomyces sp. NPDC046984]|uniref:hypothetical protein n=1 Tax=Streptomyces sp. NPDC046984 TaxID=3155138 RepID=UPI0033CEA015
MPRPLSPQEEQRRRSLNKKILGFGCLPILLLLIIVIAVSVTGSDDKNAQADDKTNSTTQSEVPHYTVINKKEKSKTAKVELVVPDATVDQAKAAIRDYASKIDGAFLDYGITVIRTKDAGTYVCSGEWLKDENAAKIYTGGRVTSNAWPTVDMNCPDPGGS